MKIQRDNTLIKFILIGILNTVVGAAIMFGLYNLAGCSYWFSSAANYILVSILSFFLNKHFTFRDKSSTAKSAVRFAINIAACYLLAYGIARTLIWHLLEQSSPTLQENLAMAVGMCLFTGLNYLGQKFLVFTASSNNIPPRSPRL